MTTMPSLALRLLPDRLAVARLDAGEPPPAWALEGIGFAALVRRDRELSVVCHASLVPDGVRADRGWSALEVQGPLDFGLTGVLAALAAPLARAKVSIFALATYDTDVVLVREGDVARAIGVLTDAGHRVSRLS